MWLLLSTFLALAPAARADDLNRPPKAIATKLIGEVRFDGRKIAKGYVVEYPGTITTGERSFVQLTIEKWDNKINIGPRSTMKVDLKGDKKYVFEQGSCRWSSLKSPGVDPKAGQGNIFTRNASMGIRGTDFILKAHPDFNETELYLLEGEVQMENANNKLDAFLVKAGYWVGVGGRFGADLTEPIKLSDTHLKKLKEELKW